MSRTALRWLCYAAGAASLIGAGAFLLLGDDPGLGIFLVLLAALLNRWLILNLAEGKLREGEDASAETEDQSA
jgi:hypothetical protein